ncbi:MAG: hypothetical protein ACLFVQ_07860 [Chitinispirillaceae bacterium]
MHRTIPFLLLLTFIAFSSDQLPIEGKWQQRDWKNYSRDNRLMFKRKWSPKRDQVYWEFKDNTLTTYTNAKWAYPFVNHVDTIPHGCFVKLVHSLEKSDSTIVVGTRDTLVVQFINADSLVIKAPSYTKGKIDRYNHKEFRRIEVIDSSTCKGE